MRTPEQDDAPEYREWLQTAILRHVQHRAWQERFERRRRVLAGAVIGVLVGALVVGGMVLTFGAGW